MPCNIPTLAIPDGFTETGKIKYKMLGRYTLALQKDYPDGIMIPCGRCKGCRADKAREWADRMMLELDHSKKAVFITLTYDDDHIPLVLDQSSGQLVPTLRKRDFQLFMKRLRKQFPAVELRYYLCGEYGEKTKRCHGHLILFGIGLDYFPDIRPKGQNEFKDQYYISDWLSEQIWQKGFCLLSEVSWKTCAYVARYVRKKLDIWHDDADKVIEPEFALMSRNPGIGAYFLKENMDKLHDSTISIGTVQGGKEVRLPSQLLRFLPDDVREPMMKERMRYATDNALAKLYQTDLSDMEMSMIEEKKLEKTDSLLDSFRTEV